MLKYAPRCKDCDCALWSEYARKLGVCPECEGQEEYEPLDLDEKLEILIEKAKIERNNCKRGLTAHVNPVE